MNPFFITTDTTADLPDDYLGKHNIGTLSLTYTLEGVTYDREHPLDVKEFYNTMRNGSLPTTSQVNPETAKLVLKDFCREEPVRYTSYCIFHRLKRKLRKRPNRSPGTGGRRFSIPHHRGRFPLRLPRRRTFSP